MQWDLFCRVIDNFGDIGVSWRLAVNLASRGERVRLWVDDPSALGWMAPVGHAGVEVLDGLAFPQSTWSTDVVIETFGCELPGWALANMAVQPNAPVWINLEYLSAEPFVRRSHGLRSPQSVGPAAGLDKWFFYPGFTAGTGGLLREPGLFDRLEQVRRSDWLQARGWSPSVGERVVVVFSYSVTDWPGWTRWMAQQPTLLLVCPGAVQDRLAEQQLPPQIRSIAVPWLDQVEFDALLACADLSFVRGEDSFVRAMWAGRPFVWQIYAQPDGVHQPKLNAFLREFNRAAQSLVATDLEAIWRAWNHLGPWPDRQPDLADWEQACTAWRRHLSDQADLCSQLIRFVSDKR